MQPWQALGTLKDLSFRLHEPLAKHSTMHVGGTALLAVFPKGRAALVGAIRIFQENRFPFAVVGRGSNLIFPDGEWNGAALFTKDLCNTALEGRILSAEAGTSLPTLFALSGTHGLSGLEFAAGIPGSLGGAIVTNAGAYGGKISDTLVSVDYYDSETDEFSTLHCKKQDFSYRESIFSNQPNFVVLGAKFCLIPKKKSEIFATVHQNYEKRKFTQPQSVFSAGSIFKRPSQELSAGELIEGAGLKGYSVGGAKVSEKHAGFIVNYENATSGDVKNLIAIIQKQVFEKYGIKLECEVKFL